MGESRNPGKEPKKSEVEVIFVKEVKCAEVGRKTAAVEKVGTLARNQRSLRWK